MRNRKAMRALGFVALLFLLVTQLSVTDFTAQAASLQSEYTKLTIHKYALKDVGTSSRPDDGSVWSSLPKDASPIHGINFNVWRVDITAGIPENVQQARKQVDIASKQSGQTGPDGTASFQLENGIYYVEESSYAVSNQGLDETAVALIPSEPFIVSLPLKDQSTGSLMSHVHVYPKNQALFIEKFVNEPGGKDYSFTDKDASKFKPVQAGEPFGWTLISSVPDIQAGTAQAGGMSVSPSAAVSYTVTDKLAEHLSISLDSIRVYAISAMDTPCASADILAEQSDYQMNFDKNTNTLSIALTAEGLAKFSGSGQPAENRYLMIKFDCMLSEEAPQGVDIHNAATVSYVKDSVSVNANVVTEPSVHSGQIALTKLSQEKSGQKLSGAKFGLAISKADAEKGNFISTGITDTEGELVFKGLPYGNDGDNSMQNSAQTSYWLVETEAPLGYVKLTNPVEVTFNHHQDTVTKEFYFAKLTVYNKAIQGKPADPNKPTDQGKSPGSAKPNPQTGDNTKLSLPLLLMAFALMGLFIAVILLRRMRKKQ